ncbi:MAG: cytochrome c-type biogenesis protein CcmH [Anaerolineales bacterium]
MKFTKRIYTYYLITITLVLFASAVIWLGTAYAQDDSPRIPSDDEVNAIAKKMYCPVCENTPLDVCPTQACTEWRELISEKLSLGWSEDQIIDFFLEQYGDRVLAMPPARGLNLLVYIIPPLVFIAGAIILFKAFVTWKKPPPVKPDQDTKSVKITEGDPSTESDPSTDSDQSDEYIQRIEEELRDM